MGVFRLLAPLQRHKLCGDMLAKSTTGTLRLIKSGVVRQSLTGLKAPPYFMYLSIGFNKVINLTEISPHTRPHNIDHTRYFRHAPARLRVVANMCGFARGYAAVCLLVPLRPAEDATQARCGVRLLARC